MARVEKLIFANGCGMFTAELPKNAIVLGVDCGCMHVLIDGIEEETVIRTFCNVQTGEEIFLGKGVWNINYIDSWRDYHMVEAFKVSDGEDDLEEAPASSDIENVEGE